MSGRTPASICQADALLSHNRTKTKPESHYLAISRNVKKLPPRPFPFTPHRLTTNSEPPTPTKPHPPQPASPATALGRASARVSNRTPTTPARRAKYHSPGTAKGGPWVTRIPKSKSPAEWQGDTQHPITITPDKPPKLPTRSRHTKSRISISTTLLCRND